MAAPSVTPGTPFATETAAANHSITLAAGTAYKAVLVSSLAASAHSIAGPTGWTATELAAITSARKLTLVQSDDPVSDTSVQIDCVTANAEVACIPLTSTDGDFDNLVIPTGVVSSGSTPDPPSTGTLTSGDYRIIAVVAYMDARRDVTGYPTNYSDGQTTTKAGTSNTSPGIGMATRGLTSTTGDDPGTFSLNGSITWATAVIAVPAGTPPAITGTMAATQEDDVMSASGSVGGGVSGTMTAVQEADVMSASGTVTGPSYPGGLPTAAVIAIYDARELAGADTDPVSAWPDTGPLGQDDLVQASGTLQPLLDDSGFGGIRAVKFDGSNDRLDMALASAYNDDFAFICVFELLTYPTGTAAVIYSTGSIPNKNIFGVDDVEDPPGFVVMSANDGTQAQHHHGVANQTYLEATPSRFISTQLVRNDGEHKLWDNATLVIDLADSSGEGSDLNNLTALKLGAREDNTRFANVRIAYMLLVDMTETDETTLLAARDELGPNFNVPGFASSNTGTITAVQQDDVMAASGTATPPAFTGTIAALQEPDVMAASGLAVPPPITGTMTATQEGDTMSAAGTAAAPSFTGTLAGVQEDDIMAASGSVTIPGVAGSLAATQESDVMSAAGTFTPPPVTGTLGATQEDDVADFVGVFDQGVSGVINAFQAPNTMTATGAHVPPPVSGDVDALQDDQVMVMVGRVVNPGGTIGGSVGGGPAGQPSTRGTSMLTKSSSPGGNFPKVGS